MNASARRSLATDTVVARSSRVNGGTQGARNHPEKKPGVEVGRSPRARPSVFVAADNRLLREALAHMLTKKGDIEVTGLDSVAPLQAEHVTQTNADVLLLTSRGTLNEDLLVIQEVRATAPKIRILLLGMAKSDGEFLQCVRAGISGYLLHDASSEDVVEGVRAVHAGAAVCPGKLCTALFRYFESEASSLPCGSARRRLGLQLLPLIAQGLTNKEIANHFSLSEQTVKNHLYRMKHKTGAGDRLDIVQLYRVQGFLV
jgi:two-component system, NarL family, response regulator DevR